MIVLNRARNLSKLWFSNAWFFYFPYAVLYSVFCYGAFSPSVLKTLFVFLHIGTLLFFLLHLYWEKPALDRSSFIFWIALTLLFLLPGAYLEFPTDPWEHLRRIFMWKNLNSMKENYYAAKMGYFWAWSIFSWLSPIKRILALNLYNCFWQLLLAYQFFLFFRRAGFDEAASRLQVLGTVALFGNNLFGFYRYYALATTPIAYICYLSSLMLILDLLEGKRNRIWFLAAALFVIGWSHVQELLFFIVMIPPLVLGALLQKRTPLPNSRKWIATGAALLFIGLGIGKFFTQHMEYLGSFASLIKQCLVPASYRRTVVQDITHLTSWGTLHVGPKNQFFQTLAIPGCIALLLSPFYFKKRPLITLLTVAPAFLLLFPPFVLIFYQIAPIEDLYRLLYAFPLSVILVEALSKGLEKIYRRSHFLVGVLVLLLALPANEPWRGRLWSQIYRPPAELTLASATRAADWFYESAADKVPCLAYSDSATEFAFSTHFGLPLKREVLRGTVTTPQLEAVHSERELAEWLKSTHACGILVVDTETEPRPPRSKAGWRSRKWDAYLLQKNWDFDESFDRIASKLPTLGWKKTAVPPSYFLYEP